MSHQNRSDEAPLPYSLDYPPPDFFDPVIEVYKRDVDRTIIRENLKLTVEERLRKHQNAQTFFEELRRAGACVGEIGRTPDPGVRFSRSQTNGQIRYEL